MNMRPLLRATLLMGGLLIVILIVACALWLALSAVGDQAGSQGAKGVALVAATCLMLDIILLVLFLALAEITRPNDASDGHEPHDGSGS
jgi:hypothetical protein